MVVEHEDADMVYETLRDELRTIVAEHADDCRIYGSRADADVRSAEDALGVTFPTEYRSFIRDFGAADFYGFEVCGALGHEPSLESNVPSCVWVTQSERKHGLPAEFVVISASGDGITYALSTVSPFAVYAYGGYDFAAHPPKVVEPSFCELLRKYIDQTQQMIDEDDE